MTAWVALLRGVNVGGITIRSADLAALFRDDLGFGSVRTSLASGTVRFETDAEDDARQPWVIFCVDDATRDELAGAAASVDSDVDPVRTGPGVVYWNPPKGSSTDTAFAKVLAKATYRSRTTNRNLRTLLKIAA